VKSIQTASIPNVKENSRKRERSSEMSPSKTYEIVIDPEEEIIIEGEVDKFKPGIEKNFIPRWL
jgi:hypothetical protein